MHTNGHCKHTMLILCPLLQAGTHSSTANIVMAIFHLNIIYLALYIGELSFEVVFLCLHLAIH